MASLEDLINSGYANQILSPQQLQQRLQDYTSGMLPEYLRTSNATAQQQAESDFGRGMGLSSYAAYQQALQTLMQNEGIAKIKSQAQQAVDQAQNTAIANAAGYSTANQNRAAQERIAAGNQTVARQLQKMRGNQAITNSLIGGAASVGGGIGGMAAKGLLAKPGSGNTLQDMYANAKANLSDLTGIGQGGAPAAPNMDLANAGAPSSGMDLSNAGSMSYANAMPSFSGDTGSSFAGFDPSSFGLSGSDSPDYGAFTFGSPSLDLNGLLASTYGSGNWGDYF